MDSRNIASEMEINTAEDMRYAAQISGDVPALERMFDKELVYAHSTGALDGKSGFIDSIKSGRVKYRSMERYDTQVRVFGAMGILTGQAKFEVSVNGVESVVRLSFHSIWEKRLTGFYFISWQATLTP